MSFISNTQIQNLHISESEKDELRLLKERSLEAENEIKTICESDTNELRKCMVESVEVHTKYLKALCRALNKTTQLIQEHPKSSLTKTI
jgi:ElaB/YqjD/DUF883 family membrane-anchored ribosome-binding protein